MSCFRYHVLLSQNLDGRLSSARREALLDHLAECGDCARLAEELRAAQELALRLPHQSIGGEFQSTLWERISAGEGTPSAVFNDHVPVAKRVLYAASGAAAAAVLLFAINLLTSQPDAGGSAPANDARVANVGRVDADSGTRAASNSPRAVLAAEADLELPPTKPLDLVSVAQRARLTALESVNNLRVRQVRLRETLRSEPGRARVELDERLTSLRVAVDLLRWMENREFIELPREFHAELSVAERGITRLESASDPEELDVALDFLSGINEKNLARFKIVCCDQDRMFLDQLADLAQNQSPDVFRVLLIAMPNGATFEVTAPGPSNPLEGARLMPK